jgi:adenylate kinase family enzyme
VLLRLTQPTYCVLAISNMNKIIIIGNSGSGKTWLGKKLASILGLSHISLDSIFWEPGGHNRKRIDSDVETDIKRIQTTDSWIIEGVFGHLVEPLIAFADTLIYINLSWDDCRYNLLNRGSESSRQLASKRAEENFQSLLIWASEYETRDSKASKKYHNYLFESFSRQKHMVFNRDEIDQLIEICVNPPFNYDRTMKSRPAS